MRANIGRDVVEVCGGFGEIVDATPALATLRQVKSANELRLLRDCYRILQGAFAEIEQRRQSGSAIAAAMIAAERTARLAGAQDVRSLCNAGAHGPLHPIGRAAQLNSTGPWSVYLAVRFGGYWTEGFTTLTSEPIAGCAGSSRRRRWRPRRGARRGQRPTTRRMRSSARLAGFASSSDAGYERRAGPRPVARC